ncbi:MAG: methyltransferase domain-containing protein [Bacteroidia bacterium]|nr:methyltransferase domain-containing protein [Bacteroidia bacterium]
MESRIDHEISHGKKLRREGAEVIWNWSTPAGKIRADKRADLLSITGKISATDSVLEIGCGTGLFTRLVYQKTKAKITATDLSEDLLEEAREKFPAGNFIRDDAMNMQFGNESFDVVFGSSILHHLSLKKSAEEIYRVLKPGGRMVFAEPNMLNPQIFIQKNIPFIKKWMGDSPDETAIVRWKYKKLLEQTGFTNVSIFPYDFLHPVTPKFFIPAVDGIGRMIEKVPLLREIAGSVIIYAEK